MNTVIYGAGNIGRGFIGQLFSRANCKVTFIDIAENIVNALKEKGAYPVRFLSNEKTEEILITGVTAVNGADSQEVIDCIAEADIIATAVGVRALPSIAPLIAGGLKKRFQISAAALNIIICENLLDADKYLSDLIKKNLDDREIKLLEEYVGFVETSIGRMVPLQTPQMQEGNILRICTEKYAFIPVNRDAFKGEIPKIEGIIPFSNFDFLTQRKIYIHNMGHALCGYLGLLLGETYISDTAARADVLLIVQNAMFESAAALNRKFKVELQDIIDHVRDLLLRFNNRSLKDTCRRVGSDIERKLGNTDRFIGAINCCLEQGVTPAFISIGAAAALYCLLKERRMAQTEKNALAMLGEIAGIEKNSAKADLILEMYIKILQGSTPQGLLHYALLLGSKAGVL